MPKKLLFNFNGEVIQDYTYIKYSGTIITATNTLEKPIKGAILEGSTKYRDIDTGEFLETFEEGRNLELVSVKMPVLTTSNEDGTKTNILTVNEDVTMRGIGNVKDELDCLTGEMTERIGEVVLDGSQPMGADSFGVYIQMDDVKKLADYTNIITCDKLPTIPTYRDLPKVTNGISGYSRVGNFLGQNWLYLKINNSVDKNEIAQWLSENPITVQYHLETESIKTVDLSILDQNENKVSSISSFNDTTYITASGETIPPIFEGYLATKEVE